VNPPRSATGSQASLREANRARVTRALREHGALTQVELVGITGLSPATMSNIVKELSGTGVIDVSATTRSGRRATRVSLARAAGVVAGLDFGQRRLRVALADSTAELLADQTLPLPPDHQGDDGLDRAATLVHELLDRSEVPRSELVAIGVGLPAPIDTVSGQVGSTTLLPGWRGIPIGESLSARIGVPVLVDNTANLGALAEVRHGAAQGSLTAAYVHADHGIGAGLVIDGQVFRGSAGTAGEIGHLTLDENGAVCRCGNRGCLETYASAPVLLDSLRASHGVLSFRDLLRLVEEGDVGARRVVADAGRSIGVAVASLCNLFNPERLIVGGALAAAGPVLFDPLREVVDRFAIPSAAASVEILPGALGPMAEVRGAVQIALESAFP
jgi:predicted NBD/HSP70 family sugar kinase